MHGYIIQLALKPIERDNYIDEWTFEEWDDIDYCRKVDEKERHDAIDWLMHDFPDGMFSRISDDCLIYNGGVAEWIDNVWLPKIREIVEGLNSGNVFKNANIYRLQRAVENGMGTGLRFYFSDDVYVNYADMSTEFIESIAGLEPGAKIYIGGIVNYHW